jgi:hypothetical protein
MKFAFAVAVFSLPLVACKLTPEQQEWNRAHHVGEIPWTGTPGVVQSSQSNGKDGPDPHPHSDSDDAQRAAYQQFQDRQNQEASKPAFAMPDSGTLTCSASTFASSAANAGSLTSSTRCHN